MATAKIIRLKVDVIGNGLLVVSSPDVEGLRLATEDPDEVTAIAVEPVRWLLTERGEEVEVYETDDPELGPALIAVPALIDGALPA